MAAPVVELCEAIADHIRNFTYSFSFQVHRVNYVTSNLEDDVLTHVYIYPAQPLGSAAEIYTRGSFNRRYEVAIHIVNFIDDQDNQAEVDDALLLAHEIEQSLENVPFGDFEMMSFTSENVGRPFFEVEQTVQRNTFHTIINVEYGGIV